MVTEVESAWSPAKKFRLVKPTFKGLEVQKLTRTYIEQWFGYYTAVSDDGNTFVAASYSSDGTGKTQYLCNVFEKTGQYFHLSHVLLPPETYYGGMVNGQSVSISGDGNTIAFGLIEPGPTGYGAVSVFTRIGTTWENQALLTANVQIIGESFGSAISLNYDGTVCGIGASEFSEVNNPGSAYVFVKSGGVWGQQTKIDPPDGIHGDFFGRFLSISGDGNTLAVSAVSGSVNPKMPYIYVRSGSAWNLQSRLVLSDGENFNVNIGAFIALSSDGNTCGFLSKSTNPGMFLFERTGSMWTQTAKILTGFAPSSSHMSRDGKTCIAGSINTHGGTGTMGGKARVSVKRNGLWTSPIELMAADGQHDDWFGSTVLLNSDGTTAFISSSDNDTNRQGAIYIFV